MSRCHSGWALPLAAAVIVPAGAPKRLDRIRPPVGELWIHEIAAIAASKTRVNAP